MKDDSQFVNSTGPVMPRQSLLEYFHPDSRPASETAFVWRRGYRTIRWSYTDVFRAATRFATQLRSQGLSVGDRVLLWGENSGEWVAAFLGCVFSGVVAVPMDAAGDVRFARRIAQQATTRIAVVARNLPPLDTGVPTILLENVGRLANSSVIHEFRFASIDRDQPVEIIFTSGTTAEPRGVVLTHGNLLASLEPIEREFKRFRRYERIFHPLRFLDLLPLSHVFGQLLGIFVPQLLGATTVFLDTLNPSEVVVAICREHVSVLITTPRLLESVKDQLERDLRIDDTHNLERDLKDTEGERFWKRWWRFRSIHRKFGWKFWAIISGGATLSAQTEKFWTKLGYAVIQGYGLTETSSVVSVNHPFRLGRGSIGKAIAGSEIKISEDGEILVRGNSVASGYWSNGVILPLIDEQGWFHTGDLGTKDVSGDLFFKGRRKNVLVTPEGLNIYPADLEAELRRQNAVRDCVIIGTEHNGNAEPCAVLLLRASHSLITALEAVAADIVDRANCGLAPFQRIRQWIVWPGEDFPRTPTQKPMLGSIKRTADRLLAGRMDQAASAASNSGGLFEDLIASITGRKSIVGDRSAKLHLSSIERVELLSALEDRYQVDVSEAEFASANTTAEIKRLLLQPGGPAPRYHYPRWAQNWIVRVFRAILFNFFARPAMLLLGWPKISGRENLCDTGGPVLVIANHVAFFDPAYVLEALPARFRNKLAVAMDGELLESMRNPPPGTTFIKAAVKRAAYWLVIGAYNVFPLPLRAGFRKSFAFAGDLVDRGWSVLIFPEGALTSDGKMNPFRAGIGLLASELGVPVVPMRLSGIFELKAANRRKARYGQIQVAIGRPVHFSDADTHDDVTRDLERRVSALPGSPTRARKD